MTETAGRNPPVMPPGRRLDAEVAEKVMGWHWHCWDVIDGFGRKTGKVRELLKPGSHRAVTFGGEPWTPGLGEARIVDAKIDMPLYSTSWDAMRLVVERLVALGCAVATEVNPRLGGECSIFRDFPRIWVVTNGDTLPHAVALAALKAVEASRE